jgi:transcriptional regulator with XRE-family HTH domain
MLTCGPDRQCCFQNKAKHTRFETGRILMSAPPDPGNGDETRRFGRDDLRLLGQYLRERRLAAGMTLRRLADSSGVSVAAIRALEAGGTNPSLTSVVQLVEALGTTIDRALAAVRVARGRVVVTRATARRGSTGQALSSGLVDAALQAETVVLPARMVGPAPAAATRHAAMCMVLDGTLTVTLDGGQRVQLDAGDSYHADAMVVQGWANTGDTPVHLLCAADTRITAPQSGKDTTP